MEEDGEDEGGSDSDNDDELDSDTDSNLDSDSETILNPPSVTHSTSTESPEPELLTPDDSPNPSVEPEIIPTDYDYDHWQHSTNTPIKALVTTSKLDKGKGRATSKKSSIKYQANSRKSVTFQKSKRRVRFKEDADFEDSGKRSSI